jgi:hypothetical protein
VRRHAPNGIAEYDNVTMNISNPQDRHRPRSLFSESYQRTRFDAAFARFVEQRVGALRAQQ